MTHSSTKILLGVSLTAADVLALLPKLKRFPVLREMLPYPSETGFIVLGKVLNDYEVTAGKTHCLALNISSLKLQAQIDILTDLLKPLNIPHLSRESFDLHIFTTGPLDPLIQSPDLMELVNKIRQVKGPE